jgi:dihydropteroate synthase
MIDLVVKSGKKIVVMHNLGIPANSNKIIDSKSDVVKVVLDWMKNKLIELQSQGVKKEQIIFDIGIGFGKNAQQSIQLLQQISQLRILGLPIYIGHSNKSFLNYLRFNGNGSFDFDDHNPSLESKEVKTLAISNYLIRNNIEYIRVHNVANSVGALSSAI